MHDCIQTVHIIRTTAQTANSFCLSLPPPKITPVSICESGLRPARRQAGRLQTSHIEQELAFNQSVLGSCLAQFAPARSAGIGSRAPHVCQSTLPSSPPFSSPPHPTTTTTAAGRPDVRSVNTPSPSPIPRFSPGQQDVTIREPPVGILPHPPRSPASVPANRT